MDITTLYHIYLQHPVISTDSRNCPPGSLFFALKGDSFDGNRFAEKALETASYAIIDDPAVMTNERMILTENALKALQDLAALHRKTMGIPVIAITGTNGKTTTKELIASVLAAQFNTLYTSGNLNNHIGVPLTLLRLTAKHQLAVIEMGANHPGEIKALAKIAQPDYGIITNIGYAHLEGFGSLDGVIRTKSELFEYIRKKDGIVFIHNEDSYIKPIAKGMRQVTYGSSEQNYISGEIIDCEPYLRLKWKHQNITHTLSTSLVGGYNLSNILAAITVGKYFDIPDSMINDEISSYKPENNRSQYKETDRNKLIIDTYNANPTSMKEALDNFSKLNVTPKMVILGDMLELGSESCSLHLEIITRLKRMVHTSVLLCGQQFSALKTSYATFPTVDLLNQHLQDLKLEGHYILIKGSRGVHLEKVIEFL